MDPSPAREAAYCMNEVRSTVNSNRGAIPYRRTVDQLLLAVCCTLCAQRHARRATRTPYTQRQLHSTHSRSWKPMRRGTSTSHCLRLLHRRLRMISTPRSARAHGWAWSVPGRMRACLSLYQGAAAVMSSQRAPTVRTAVRIRSEPLWAVV